MPAKHVQQYVNNAQKIVKEIREWNNAKAYAEPVLMPVANVQRNAGTWAVMHLNQHKNALMPAVPVLKSVKSTTMKRAKNAQKNAESVKRNAERLRLEFLNKQGIGE
jgi:hypothetical protein